MKTVPLNSGTYCLVMRLDHKVRVQVGRLGVGAFPAGYYCYVGSALRGLEQRVARHFAWEKRMHWHVDYLLTEARALGAMVVRSENRLECEMSRLLAGEAPGEPMTGFGASDCSCRTHLYHFKKSPTALIRGIFTRCEGGEKPVYWPNRA